MSDLDGKEQELEVKRVIRQVINDQLNELKADKQESNNSLVSFEKSTLNISMNFERRTGDEVNGNCQVKILEELEQVIGDNKKDFEEILTLLKEKF
jgi:hypothetical protein